MWHGCLLLLASQASSLSGQTSLLVLRTSFVETAIMACLLVQANI